jgi:2-polyprenyl-3-methyl-5-hydroxy-6-metoxy-1,4-benzoquinol methylase
MDAEERLTPTQLDEPTFMAAHHLLRYEFAASLCQGRRVLDLGCGVGYGAALLAERGAASVEGVDVDERTVAEATSRYGSEKVRFTTSDAVDRLRALEPGDVDVVVSFEAIEHLPDAQAAVERLAALVEAGTAVIVSVPNSRMFEEDNEFHVTDFDYESARELLSHIPGIVLLTQFLAEGSVITGAGDTYCGPVGFPERGEPEYANTIIGVAGLEEATTTEAVAHLNLAVVPNHNRYMLGLERLNRSLYAANSALANAHLGRSDAGGASVLDRLQHRIAEQEAEIAGLKAHISANDDRIHDLVEIAATYKERARRVELVHVTRRHQLVERTHGRVVSLPGVRHVLALRGKLRARGS